MRVSLKQDALQKCLSLKISKLYSLYFYFARFWQYRPIRECLGKSQKKFPWEQQGTDRMFPSYPHNYGA